MPSAPTFWYQTQRTGTPWTGGSRLEVLPHLIDDWNAADVGPPILLMLLTWPLVALAGGRPGSAPTPGRSPRCSTGLDDADTVIFCPGQRGPDVVRRLHPRPRLLSFPEQDFPGRA